MFQKPTRLHHPPGPSASSVSPSLPSNIGQTRRSTWTRFGSEDPWVRKNHPALQQALTLVGQHIGQIALTGPAGAAVIVSGKASALPLRRRSG